MLLSAEQFSEITRELEHGGVATGRETEHRRAPRAHPRALVSVIPVEDGRWATPVTAMVRDVSSRGVNILFARTMKRGSQFVVRLPREDGPCAQFLCTVAHARELRDGQYGIGAEFTCLLPDGAGGHGSSPTEERRIRGSILG
ncbi:MAG TPA: PilZ domain-containing protein [Tepidisphaeraceae bacterium]|nr:PilZ domain-containing protein [Tepidisphaeraceae bacterium]